LNTGRAYEAGRGEAASPRYVATITEAGGLHTRPARIPTGAAPAQARLAELLRADRRLVSRLVLAVLVLLALGISAWLFPRNVFFFHADWFLHPNEQEHLTISRNLAKTGSLVIEDDWYAQSPAHGSEDKGLLDGRLVPRSSIVPYFIFAVPFLISDTAWRFVTPFFGLLAAAICGVIVWRRTGSRPAGLAAGAVLLTTASVLLNSGGLALENVIALAFLLAAVYLFDRLVASPSIALGVGAGLMFSLAAGTRLDLAPAGVVACALLLGRIVRRGADRPASQPQIEGAAAMVAVFLGAVIVGLLFNFALYGDALSTGYGGAAWQGSASGVSSRLLDFSVVEFKDMAWAFLFQIGKMQTVLLLAGVVWLAYRRLWRPADIVLLALAGWLVFLHLGNDSVTGGSEPFLVNSPPRYLQPVYATGVLLGIEAAYRVFRSLSIDRFWGGLRLALGATTLLAVSVSLSEAYGGTWAIPSAAQDAKELRAVHEFANEHPGAVFVGDYNTKAIISEHTLIPRLLPNPDDLAAYVEDELRQGSAVYIVDSRARRDPNNGYYSGYLARLGDGGLATSVVPGTPAFLEVQVRAWQDSDVAAVLQALPNAQTETQLLFNPQFVWESEEVLPAWTRNGNAWFVPMRPGQPDGIRVRNTAAYGGVRQVLPAEQVAGTTLTGIAAVRGLAETGAARQVLFGLYDNETREPLVETVAALKPEVTTYITFEVFVPQDSQAVRLVISSGRYDYGDYVIRQAALFEGGIIEVLGR
jgi:hypothetical protein